MTADLTVSDSLAARLKTESPSIGCCYSDEETLENNNSNDNESLLISQPKQRQDGSPPTAQLSRCHRCDRPISDRFFLRVGVDASFHCRCLSCWACGAGLESAGKCYCRDGRLYCWEDYCRLFSLPQSCPRCRGRLQPSDLVMRAGSRRYHPACFTCAACHRRFEPGDKFGLGASGEVFCQAHLPHSARGVGSDEEAKSHEKPPSGMAASRPKGRPKKPKAEPVSSGNAAVAMNQLNQLPTADETPAGMATVTAASHLLQRLADAHAAGSEDALHACLALGSGEADPTDCIALPTSSPSELGEDQPLTDQPHQRPAGHQTHRQQQPPPEQLQQRQKRVRTSFKHHQLRTMKAYFLVNHNPDSKDLKQLAQKTCLSKRVLQVWFQNARAKYRRALLKQPNPEHQEPSQFDLSPEEKRLQLLQQFQLLDDAASDFSSSGNAASTAEQTVAAEKAEDRSIDAEVESEQDFITLHNVNCSA